MVKSKFKYVIKYISYLEQIFKFKQLLNNELDFSNYL